MRSRARERGGCWSSLPVLLGNSIHGELWVPTSPSRDGLEAGDVLACPLWDFTPAPLPAGRECDV